MTEEQQVCQVCGRSQKELEDIKAEPEIMEHQGIHKCKKCRRAYMLENEEDTQNKSEVDVANKMGWTV